MIWLGGGFGLLFLLIALGVPLGFAMTIVGFAGVATLAGTAPASFMVAQIVFDTGLTYSYAVLPLFILMGNLVARSRLADDLFDAAYAFVGHRPGGLAKATILACAGFSAICGSSSATAATMVRVALPAMRRRGYDDRLATGTIAVGGTLGILIPPSAILLIYGIITQNDIAALFAAGLVPGLVAIACHYGAIAILTGWTPALGPAADRTAWPGRLHSLARIWGILALFIGVMGGIFAGAFTPTEGGAIGAAGAFAFAVARRALTRRLLFETLLETGRTSAMIFMILFGALIFSNFVELTGFPKRIGELIAGLELGATGVMLAIVVIYILLGCVLESLSMMFLTIPLFYPIVTGLGFDPVWFGVVLVVVIEMSLITPPIGLNIFVMKAMMPDVSMTTLFRGIAPFVLSTLVLLLLILFIPDIALVLPRALG